MNHLRIRYRARHCQFDVVSRDIEADCVAAVVRQLPSTAARMGVSELRGYVRARASGTVRTIVEAAINDGRLPSPNRDELVAAILRRVVHIVVCDLQSPPTIAMPAPHIPARAAA